MSVKIIDIKDANFKFKKSLASLGFRGDSLNLGVKVAEDVLDNFAILQVAKFKTAQNKVQRFEKNLKKLLSTDTKSKYGNKRRHGNRKYPGSVSGKLVDSIEIDLQKTVTSGRWTYEFTARAGGDGGNENPKSKDHAKLTNENIVRGGHSSRNVAWKGWWDEAMGMGHSSSLIGARVLMSNLFKGGTE
jgi:hypothetical protein